MNFIDALDHIYFDSYVQLIPVLRPILTDLPGPGKTNFQKESRIETKKEKSRM